MTPRSLSLELRRMSEKIDASEKPSRAAVASALASVLCQLSTVELKMDRPDSAMQAYAEIRKLLKENGLEMDGSKRMFTGDDAIMLTTTDGKDVVVKLV